MAEASWTLIGSPGATPPASAGAGTGAPTLPCPIDPLTQQDFLDLFDRLLPAHYLGPLKSPGPGYELLRGIALALARASTAAEHLGCGAYISSSAGGAFATGTVELFRAATNAEGISVVVKTGTIVGASRSGRRFGTTADVTFASSDLGPFTVGVEAVALGYDYNLPGTVIAADGSTLPGEIDTIFTLVESPDCGDLSIQVRQPVATVGGVDPSLDQHGLDRGIPRLLGEADGAYRARIRSLPDNISPGAVERALLLLLTPVKANADFVETWDVAYQTCYDAPSAQIAGSNFNPNLFCYDDPRAPAVINNRWLDENDYRGAFIVYVDKLPAIADVGMALDDTAANPTAHNTSIGRRAHSAYDVPATFTAGAQGGYDGFDLPKQAVYKGLYDMLQGIKAAGTSAAVELRGQ